MVTLPTFVCHKSTHLKATIDNEANSAFAKELNKLDVRSEMCFV